MQTNNEPAFDHEIDLILLESLLIENPDATCIDYINYRKSFYLKQKINYNETSDTKEDRTSIHRRKI